MKTINSPGYWTKERCHQEALQYEYRGDFNKYSKAAYSKAYKKGWLDDICGHMKTKTYEKLTKEICIQAILKYKSITELIEKDNRVYRTIINNGWKDILNHIPRKIKPAGYWTKERCHHEALKYNTKTAFQKGCMAAYVQAVKKKFLDEICQHMDIIGNTKLRHIYIFEFDDNHFYVGISCNPKSRYNQHMSLRAKRPSPIIEHINNTGSKFKFTIITEKPIYIVDAGNKEKELIRHYCDNGWIKLNKTEGGEYGGNKINWTKELAHIESLKYNSRTEFKKACPGLYKISTRNNWIDDICSHMNTKKKLPIGYWNIKENCYSEAIKHPNIRSLQKASSTAYKYMVKNNWIYEFFPNTIRNKKEIFLN